eukprot:765785-Hanusia_phi.AAC.3
MRWRSIRRLPERDADGRSGLHATALRACARRSCVLGCSLVGREHKQGLPPLKEHVRGAALPTIPLLSSLVTVFLLPVTDDW